MSPTPHNASAQRARGSDEGRSLRMLRVVLISGRFPLGFYRHQTFGHSEPLKVYRIRPSWNKAVRRVIRYSVSASVGTSTSHWNRVRRPQLRCVVADVLLSLARCRQAQAEDARPASRA
jgi:hypothetical protein